MNILFFLMPKSEVDYVYDDASIFKAMQIFDRHNFFSLPLINKRGRYIGAITTSDLLGCIKENFDLSVKKSADCANQENSPSKRLQSVRLSLSNK